MKDWIEQHQITEVECIVPDLAGSARGKIMPASKFVGAGVLRMPQGIFLQSVTGDYPEIWASINPLDVDMVLKPDPDTIRLLPWAREPSAQVIHDCYDLDGKPIWDVVSTYLQDKKTVKIKKMNLRIVILKMIH